MIRTFRNPNQGITLIEVLLYTALITVFITLALPLLVDIHIWQGKQNKQSKVLNEYLFVHVYFSNLIKYSREIAVPSVGQFSDTLALTSPNNEQVRLGLNKNGAIYVEIEGGEQINLTTDNIANDINFARSQVGVLEKIEFSITFGDLHLGTSSLIISHD